MRINKAYQTLSDVKLRAQYDKELRQVRWLRIGDASCCSPRMYRLSEAKSGLQTTG